MTYDASLDSLRTALAELRQRQRTLPDFCQAWRSQSALLEALPTRYRKALEDLLGRLESAAPFAENCCCTLNQSDLLDSFDHWLDQARRTLEDNRA